MLTKVRDTPEKEETVRTASPENGHGPCDPLDVDLPISASLLSRNLLLFTVLKTIGSFDSGAFSAALGAENGIAEEWGLSTVQQGTLSSSVFLGNILGCPLSGNLFTRYSAKAVLVWSLVLHTVFTFIFATLTDYTVALFCRFLIGITLSFVIVYTPVWVDAFAPRDRQSVWMASHNAGVPLGIMIGYSFGAFLPSYTNINWEWAFYIKCIITVPALGYLMRVDKRSIDWRCTDKEGVTPAVTATAPPSRRSAERIFNVLHSNMLYLWRTCAPLIRNTEYMCSALAMCSLYFVVTGLQNFVTQYLRADPFNASMKTIMIGFGGAVVTAPVFGVITGGVLLDRIGGYQRNLRRVTMFTCVWGAAAAFFSVMCIFVRDTMTFLFVISIVLFCGGAIIPPVSGTVMSSVPEKLRPAGAAISQMMYNLLGNFSGPMVCGLVADWTGELKYGIYTVLCCSVVGMLPMLVLLRKAYSMPDPLAQSSRERVSRPHHAGTAEDVVLVSVDAELNDAGAMKSESPRIALQDDDIPQYNGSITTPKNSSNGALFTTFPASPSPPNRMLLTVPSTAPTDAGRTVSAAAPIVIPMSSAAVVESDRTPPLPGFLSAENTTPKSPGFPQCIEDSHNRNRYSAHDYDDNSNDSEDPLDFESDAAQMMSFPNQHNFGLDMLRSWLNSTSRRRNSSLRSSANAVQSLLEEVSEIGNVDTPQDVHFSGSELNDASGTFVALPQPPPPPQQQQQQQQGTERREEGQ
ncbi:putative transporter protein [Trypanosoma grayi]|uniref:putative transporter protein n=1 Tax=Trypanosoma grayi TaxID=71804 RepID=UPI0004F47F62|nr:putative transporter protein [Trypanosoma grayi]KEG10067.1 putative transporter protein [Trypanosoma grayi]